MSEETIEDIVKDAEELVRRSANLRAHKKILNVATGFGFGGALAGLAISATLVKFSPETAGAATQYLALYMPAIGTTGYFVIRPTPPLQEQENEETLFSLTQAILEQPDIPKDVKAEVMSTREFYTTNSVDEFNRYAPNSHTHFSTNPLYRLRNPIESAVLPSSFIYLNNVGIDPLTQYSQLHGGISWVHDGTGSTVLINPYSPEDYVDPSAGPMQAYDLAIEYNCKWRVGIIRAIEKSKGDVNYYSREEVKQFIPAFVPSFG